MIRMLRMMVPKLIMRSLCTAIAVWFDERRFEAQYASELSQMNMWYTWAYSEPTDASDLDRHLYVAARERFEYLWLLRRIENNRMALTTLVNANYLEILRQRIKTLSHVTAYMVDEETDARERLMGYGPSERDLRALRLAACPSEYRFRQ